MSLPTEGQRSSLQITSETNAGIRMVVLYGIPIVHISEIVARTGPAQGSTLHKKDVNERGGMRNQCPKATKLANYQKKKSSTARLTLMYKCFTNQAAIDIPCYVQHQSSLKPWHLIH